MTDALATIDGFDLAREYAGMPEAAREGLAVWLSLPDRTMPKACQLLGIPEDRMRQWSSRYRWADIGARYDAHQANALMAGLRSAIVRHSFRAVEIGVLAMEDENAKWGDRLKAAAWIASLGGLGPRSMPAIPDVDNGVGSINADDLRKLATSGDPEDLKRLVKLTTGQRD